MGRLDLDIYESFVLVGGSSSLVVSSEEFIFPKFVNSRVQIPPCCLYLSQFLFSVRKPSHGPSSTLNLE